MSIGYVYHLNNNGIRSAVCRINDDADLNPSELNLNFNLGHLWERFRFRGSSITKCPLFSSFSMRYSGGVAGEDGAEMLIH